MYSYIILMSLAYHPYVLVCHLHVTRRHSYVTRCHLYVLVCHSYEKRTIKDFKFGVNSQPFIPHFFCSAFLSSLKLITNRVWLKLHIQITTFFFLSGFSFTDTGDSQDSKGREETTFCFTLPLPPDCYSMRFTTLSNYHCIDWLMIQIFFVYLINWF